MMRISFLLCLLILGATTACAPDYSPTDEEHPTAPRIGDIVPADRATNVPLTAIITVSFTAALDPATVTSSSVRLRDRSGRSIAATRTLSADGTVLTITPATALAEGMTYVIEISREIRDQYGIPLDIGGFDGLFTAQFTTLATPPTVVSVTPADETEVAADMTEVVVTFSEPMNPAVLTPATVLVSDLEGDVTYDPKTMSVRFLFRSGALLPQHRYTIFVAATVTDANGVPLGNDVISHFTVIE